MHTYIEQSSYAYLFITPKKKTVGTENKSEQMKTLHFDCVIPSSI